MTSLHDARRSPWPVSCALLLMIVNACTIPYEQNDWAAYDGPGQEYFEAEELGFSFDLMDDPLEPINRPISVFNYGLLYGILQPVAWGYREVVPEAGRDAVGNLFANWLYPARLVNNLLQAQWDGAGRETQRFLINTTAGVLGLFDPAKSHWEIDPSSKDMGQTFHDWGWRNSTYFVMPLFGPTTIRDGFGQIGDYYLDPLTYTSQPQGLYAQYFRTFDALSEAIPGIVAFVQQNYDPYQLSKLLFIFNREIQTEDYSTQSEDSGDTETLASIFFRPQDPDWDNQGETHTLSLSNGRKITYTAWLQEDPAPIFYFIPGTGGHRLENSALAVSELISQNGRHVVTISSALNSEFIDNTLSSAVPGFMPSDAHDTHLALDAIQADLERRYSPEHFSERWLGGLSLGAMTTLYIAAANAESDNTLVDFHTYVPVNCPVSLEHAVKTLDRFYNTPVARFSLDERPEKVRGVLRKALDLGTSGDFKPSDELPFVDWEARFLIGFAFRLTIIAIIQDTQDRHDLAVLRTQRQWYRRSMSYLECSTFSFMEYLYGFVLPYYASLRDDISFDDQGAETMLHACDLRSIEAQLKGRDDILFVTNRNDPLLYPDDLSWIKDTFGSKLLLFDRGGHLGNLGHKDVQAAIHHAVQSQLDGE